MALPLDYKTMQPSPLSGLSFMPADIPQAAPAAQPMASQEAAIMQLLQSNPNALQGILPSTVAQPTGSAVPTQGGGLEALAPQPVQAPAPVAEVPVPVQAPVQAPAPAPSPAQVKQVQAKQVVDATVPPSPIDIALGEMPDDDAAKMDLIALKEAKLETPEEVKGFWESNPGIAMTLMQVGAAMASGGDVNKALSQGFAGIRADRAAEAKGKRDTKADARADRSLELQEFNATNNVEFKKQSALLAKQGQKNALEMFNVGEKNKAALQAARSTNAKIVAQLKIAADEKKEPDVDMKEVLSYAKGMVEQVPDNFGGTKPAPITPQNIWAARNTLLTLKGKPPIYMKDTPAGEAKTVAALGQEGISGQQAEIILKNYADVYGYDAAVRIGSLFKLDGTDKE